jgi:hypothetical protein
VTAPVAPNQAPVLGAGTRHAFADRSFELGRSIHGRAFVAERDAFVVRPAMTTPAAALGVRPGPYA